jgi:hypothetical protein
MLESASQVGEAMLPGTWEYLRLRKTSWMLEVLKELLRRCKTSVICSYFNQKYSSHAICPEVIVIG